MGKDTASSAVVATGSVQIHLGHLPEVKEVAKNFRKAKFGEQPFSEFSSQKIQSTVEEMFVDTLHRLVAHGGMLSQTLQNALGIDGAAREASGTSGGLFLTTTLQQMFKNAAPFADFSQNRSELAEDILNPHSGLLTDIFSGNAKKDAVDIQSKISLRQSMPQLSSAEFKKLSKSAMNVLAPQSHSDDRSAGGQTSSFTNTQETSLTN